MKSPRGMLGGCAVALALVAVSCTSPVERAPSLKSYRPDLNGVTIGTYSDTQDLFAVAVSQDGRYQWSFDFETWSAGTKQTGGPPLRTVSASPKFYVLGGDTFRVSLCVTTLDNCIFADQAKTGAFRKSAVCGDYFYVVGDGGIVQDFAGPGPINAAKGTAPSDNIVGIACDGTRVVVVSESDAAFSGSINGDLTRVAGTGHACGLAYGAGVFVEARIDGIIETSADGQKWEASTTAQFPAAESCDIAFGHGTFVVTSTNGDVFTSADGKAWTRFDVGAGKHLTAVALNNAGKMLAVGTAGVAVEATCGNGVCSQPKTHEILVEAIGSGDAGK